MTDSEGIDRPPAPPVPTPCRHLRNKGMYVYSDGQGGESHSDYDNTIYWCLKTMKEYGPDDDMVAVPECHDPQRTCHEPF